MGLRNPDILRRALRRARMHLFVLFFSFFLSDFKLVFELLIDFIPLSSSVIPLISLENVTH